MKIITDLHVHSRFARWCSNRLTVENNWKTCIIKWIDVLWTWDFTHPMWIEQLDYYLENDWKWFLIPKKKYLDTWIEEISIFIDSDTYYKIKNWFFPRFILQTEINSVFQRWNNKYRIHNCIYIDSLENAKKILNYLSNFGKVESDGRLAVRQDQEQTLVWLKTNFPQSIFIPAHIWTPYFWVFGSKSGFDTIMEAFGNSYMLVDWIETWLSSDPIMNWINPTLDPFSIISSSDAHSPENFAREATVFDISINFNNLSYHDIEKAIKKRKYSKYFNDLNDIEKWYLNQLFIGTNNTKLLSTIEFFPQEWKYYADGHAKCNFVTTPSDTIAKGWKCPVCWGKLTIGVFHRTYERGNQKLMDEIWFCNNWFWSKTDTDNLSKKFDRPNFEYIVPLWDIIREVWSAKKMSKKAEMIYNQLIKTLWPEFKILLDISLDSAIKFNCVFWESLNKVRNWNITIKPWYDWLFGVVSINICKPQLSDLDNSWIVQDSLF